MTGDPPPLTATVPPPALATASSTEAARTISSQELMQGHRELLIEHAGETYRLRVTRNGKLILNK